MAYQEFEGELDAPADGKTGGGFVEFDGKLDEEPKKAAAPSPAPAPAEERTPRRGTMRGVTPFVGGDERQTSQHGAGRGSINPPLVNEPRRQGESVLDLAARPENQAAQAFPATPEGDQRRAALLSRESVEPSVQARSERLSQPMRGTGVAYETPLEQRMGDAARVNLQRVAGKGGAAIAGGILSGGAELGKTGTGLVTAAADAVGAEGLSEFAQGATRRGSGFQQGVMPQGEGIDKHVAEVFSSITANAPVMALGVAGQTAALRTMFAQTAAANYGELRSQGFAPLPSVAASTINSGAEVLGERFGFKEQTIAVKGLMTRMLKAGYSTDDMAKNAAKLLVKELPGEELTTTIQFLNEKYGFAPRSPEATLEAYLKQLGDTAITTMGQSGVVGGAPLVLDARKAVVKRAEDAINVSAGMLPKGPYRDAAEKGFIIDPPLITDPVSTQRAKTIAIFEEAAATAGVPANVVKRAKEAAGDMPARDVGPFLNNLIGVLQKKGAVATPLPDHVKAALTAGPAIPLTPDEQAEAELATKTTEELAKTEAAKADSPVETPAPSAAPAPAIDETAAAPAAPAAALVRTESGWKVTPVDEAAHTAASSPQNDLVEPTNAQKEAGNYKKGHTKIAGLDVSIENPEGSVRRDTKNDPPKWQNTMRAHYGYFRGTVGQDGEHIDTFIQPGTPPDYSGNVFVIDQVDRQGRPDEHKVMLGYDTLPEAKKAYLAHYPKGWKGAGAITATTMDGFKDWLKNGDTTKPFAQTKTNVQSAQPDLQPAPLVAPESAAARGDQPSGSVGTVGPVDGARTPASAAAAPAPAPSPRPADAAGNARGSAPAVGPRAIGRAGTTPNTATPIELRANKDGTLTPWHDGHELLDFDTAEPVKIPAGATDREALDAIKGAGAFGRRTKIFAEKSVDTSDETPVDESAKTQEPASNAKPKPEAKPKTDPAKTAKARMALNVETDSVLEALAKLGGIKRTEVAREFGLKPEELRQQVPMGGVRGWPFRVNGGMSIDQAITALQEVGYFMGVAPEDARGALETAIHDELGGARVLTPMGREREAAAMLEADAQAERDGLMDEAGISEAEMAALDDDDIDLDGKSNVSAQAFMRAMGFSEKEIEDEIAKQRRDAQESRLEDGADGTYEASSPAGSRGAEARPEPADTGLTDAEAFADDYRAFDGRTIERRVEVDTGQTAILKFDAAKALRSLDTREQALKGLLDCLRKAA